MKFVAFILFIALYGVLYMLGYWDGITVGKVRGACELREQILLDIREDK